MKSLSNLKRQAQRGFNSYRADDRGRDHRHSGGRGAAGYQNYTVRAKVSELILAASSARTCVTEAM